MLELKVDVKTAIIAPSITVLTIGSMLAEWHAMPIFGFWFLTASIATGGLRYGILPLIRARYELERPVQPAQLNIPRRASAQVRRPTENDPALWEYTRNGVIFHNQQKSYDPDVIIADVWDIDPEQEPGLYQIACEEYDLIITDLNERLG